MKLKVLLGFAVVMIAALAGGAYWFFVVNMIHGSGVELVETRELDSFHQIHLSCAADVDVSIGEVQSITVTGDDNIVPLITTELSEGRMTIDCDKRYRSKLGINLKVTVLKLDSLVLGGSGDIKTGAIEGDSMNAEISGSGSIKIASFTGSSCQTRVGGSGSVEIGRLKGKDLTAKVSGSGNVKISGEATNLEAKISGSGNLNLADLTVQNAVAKVSGSGNIKVRAEESLKAGISGSGNISQYGKAKPDASVSGSGRVNQR